MTGNAGLFDIYLGVDRNIYGHQRPYPMYRALEIYVAVKVYTGIKEYLTCGTNELYDISDGRVPKRLMQI